MLQGAIVQVHENYVDTNERAWYNRQSDKKFERYSIKVWEQLITILMSRFGLKGRLMYAEAMEIAKKNSRLFTWLF